PPAHGPQGQGLRGVRGAHLRGDRLSQAQRRQHRRELFAPVHPMKTKKRTSPPTFLVGDIGGTRTRLALYTDKGRAPLFESVLPSQEYRTFDEIAAQFLAETDAPHPG